MALLDRFGSLAHVLDAVLSIHLSAGSWSLGDVLIEIAAQGRLEDVVVRSVASIGVIRTMLAGYR